MNTRTVMPKKNKSINSSISDHTPMNISLSHFISPTERKKAVPHVSEPLFAFPMEAIWAAIACNGRDL